MTRKMVEVPLDIIELLFERELYPCEYCELRIATYAGRWGCGARCDECMSDTCEKDGELHQVPHIDDAREFNAALQAAREDGAP